MMPALPDAATGPATFSGEAVHMAIVAAMFLTIFLIAELWTRARTPEPELTRKFVHFAGGLVAMSFPWLFASHVSVLLLAIAFVLVLVVGHRTGLVTSVHGVARRSYGELYFPLAIYLLFLVAHRQPLFYAVALSALVVSDALAAVLGRAYGRRLYQVEGDRRSWEGSTVFFLVTFLGVQLPLLLLTPLDRLHVVLIAFQVALLVTAFEAISLHGSDNLFIPLGTYFLLVKMSAGSAHSLSIQVGAQLALLAAVSAIAWRTRFLTASGAIAAHLVLYAAFSLGGPRWTIAPALVLAGLIALDPSPPHGDARAFAGYQVRAVFYVALVAVLMIFADNTAGMLSTVRFVAGFAHPFFVPFVAALGGQLTLITALKLRSKRETRQVPVAVRFAGAVAIGVLAVAPLSLVLATGRVEAEAMLLAFGVSSVALALHAFWRHTTWWPRGTTWDFRLQTASVALPVFAAIPIHLWWIDAVGSRAG
jgi:phytol kinase